MVNNLSDGQRTASRAALQELTARAEQLRTESGTFEYSRLAGVLDAMAATIASVQQAAGETSATRIRSLADELKELRPSSLEYADNAVTALGEAVSASAAMVRCDSIDFRAVSERAGLALARLDLKLTLPAQESKLLTAVHAVTDAVLMAGGGDPVFSVQAPLASSAQTPLPVAATFGAHATRAHELLLQLSRAQWDMTRRHAGQVLAELAGALDSSEHRAEVLDPIKEVRFQAERLRRSDAMAFARGGWVKSALASALSALEHLAPAERREEAAPWIARGRATIQLIDEKGSLGFQRAVIQDALRTVTDAFLVVSQIEDQRIGDGVGRGSSTGPGIGRPGGGVTGGSPAGCGGRGGGGWIGGSFGCRTGSAIVTNIRAAIGAAADRPRA